MSSKSWASVGMVAHATETCASGVEKLQRSWAAKHVHLRENWGLEVEQPSTRGAEAGKNTRGEYSGGAKAQIREE